MKLNSYDLVDEKHMQANKLDIEPEPIAVTTFLVRSYITVHF